MKHKIKNFFITLGDYICLPFLRLSTRKSYKKLAKIAAEDRVNLLTGKNSPFNKNAKEKGKIKTLLYEKRNPIQFGLRFFV